jgi:hypothetical protein
MKVVPERDVWALAEQPAPTEPTPGMRLWINSGASWRDGYQARVASVSNACVTVRSGGRLERFPRAEWARWLLERSREGPVQVDGHPITPPAVAPLALGLAERPTADEGGSETMEHDARDARIFRAVRDVVKGYVLRSVPSDAEGLLAFAVTKPGHAPYTVKLDPAWKHGPQCSCPDWLRVRDGDRGGFCKHVVAVLLQSDESRHQLIDLLL